MRTILLCITFTSSYAIPKAWVPAPSRLCSDICSSRVDVLQMIGNLVPCTTLYPPAARCRCGDGTRRRASYL
eukprot:gene12921-biopygen3370